MSVFVCVFVRILCIVTFPKGFSSWVVGFLCRSYTIRTSLESTVWILHSRWMDVEGREVM